MPDLIITLAADAGDPASLDRVDKALAAAALAGERAHTDLFDRADEAEIGHIRLAREADAVVVAPATANIMARMANGLCLDLASTVLLADRVVVVEGGRIVEEGSHESLLARGGLYARYWNRQSGGFLSFAEAAE